MPRIACLAVLAIGLVCVIALAGYRWHGSRSAHDTAHHASTSTAASKSRYSLQPTPLTVKLSQPSAAPDVLSVRLRQGLQVRFLVDMPGMPGMGRSTFDSRQDSGNAYSGIVVFPMAGLTRVVVQVLSHGTWQPVQTLLYNVDAQGIAHAVPVDRAERRFPPGASVTAGVESS